jgi:serine/threonine-protein kinase
VPPECTDAASASFAPDGAGIVFQRNGNLWYRVSERDTVLKPVAVAAIVQQAPRVSADGRWVAYGSEESGKSQVYVKPFPSLSGRYQVSVDGGAAPVWSRDSKRLVYQVGGRVLIAASFSSAPTFAVTRRDTLFRCDFYNYNPHASYDVSPDGSHVLVQAFASNPQWVVVHNG